MFLRSLLVLSALLGATAFADVNGDLTLPGERWVTAFNAYVCENAQYAPVSAPRIYNDMNLQFERFSTDRTLRNAIMSASFVENGSVCRYSALLKADLQTKLVRILDSKAYAPEGGSDCVAGKTLLDGQFDSATFIFNERAHPHHLSFVFPFVDSIDICGARATGVGVDFVLKKRITTP